ncbi:MAG: FUSC family protein [Propionicimonas sp.]
MAPLFVLVIANAILGRYAWQVAFLTPVVILLGSSGSAAGLATERVAATLVGAILAGVAALGLLRFERSLSVSSSNSRSPRLAGGAASRPESGQEFNPGRG